MNPALFLPPDVVDWLLRYGVFGATTFFLALGLAVLLRPFWLWLTGRSELLDRLKRLEELQRKSLLELEILNQTLSVPIKRAAKKTESPSEEPLVVSDATKEGFLKALAKTREAVLNKGADS